MDDSITALGLAMKARWMNPSLKPRDRKTGRFIAFKNKSLVERMIPMEDEINLFNLRSQIEQIIRQ